MYIQEGSEYKSMTYVTTNFYTRVKVVTAYQLIFLPNIYN